MSLYTNFGQKEDIMRIHIDKSTIFKLKNKTVIATRDVDIVKKGFFILNFWEQCDFSDINVLPVVFVHCETTEDESILRRDNIVLGDEKDICLI